MKRRRNSRVTKSNTMRGRKETWQVTQYSGHSFSDLPRDILLNIILRLSIKRILVCKCVCKTWYDLVSDPEFAKLHFDQAQDYPLIRDPYSRMLYLVHQDKDDFELKLGMCDHFHFKSGCVCNVRVKLDTKFKILERNKCMDQIYKYNIVNSCKGLLCFLDTLRGRPHPIVCNPLTGEFIELPKPRKVDTLSHEMYCGLGFSPGSNQYKVIRMFRVDGQNLAQVHILGTKKWRCIGFFTQPLPRAFCAYYLNGFFYWSSIVQPLSVFTFDIENESFGSISELVVDQSYLYSTLEVLGQELCIYGVLVEIMALSNEKNMVNRQWLVA